MTINCNLYWAKAYSDDINTNDMKFSRLSLAKKKLEIHSKEGCKSRLSILEVARLHDIIKIGNHGEEDSYPIITFSAN